MKNAFKRAPEGKGRCLQETVLTAQPKIWSANFTLKHFSTRAFGSRHSCCYMNIAELNYYEDINRT
jgi:hypothetical protein